MIRSASANSRTCNRPSTRESEGSIDVKRLSESQKRSQGVIFMHTAGFFIAIFVSAIVLAEEPKEAPKSPAAMTAIRERDHAIEMAEQAYRQAKVAAEKRLIGKLKVLMFVATKAGDLDEANRINARMKEAQAVIGDAGAGAKSSADSIDLLKSLDLSRDTVGGKWKSAKGALLVDQPSGLSRLRLRVKAERPYVLRAEFVRTADGGNFAIYLPVANSTVTLLSLIHI